MKVAAKIPAYAVKSDQFINIIQLQLVELKKPVFTTTCRSGRVEYPVIFVLKRLFCLVANSLN